MQAEDFASVTDPDGDGDVWEIVSDSEAHGGQAIQAPSGSRTNLPSHDTLALYNVSFTQAGTYTAYYRAYGTNGSSNSFYAPDGFGVDPTVNESTSENGEYRWETGREFTVSSSDVGVTQQLRIGRREGDNRIDAIVIHESGSLSMQELDALFTNPPAPPEPPEPPAPPTPPFILGDINIDGVVGFFDINPFIALLTTGTFQAEADCNQDGVVNFLDISSWIAILTEQ